MNKNVLLVIGVALVATGVALYMRRRKIENQETEEAKAASGRVFRTASPRNRAVGRPTQSFSCAATGESITTNDYNEYVQFKHRCEQAGGRLNRVWDGLDNTIRTR